MVKIDEWDDFGVPLLLPECMALLPPLEGTDSDRAGEELYIEFDPTNNVFVLSIPHLELGNAFDMLNDAIWVRDALFSDNPKEIVKVIVHKAQRRGETHGWKYMIDICKKNHVPGFEGVGWDGLQPYHISCEGVTWDTKTQNWKLDYGGVHKGQNGAFVANFKLWELDSAIKIRDKLRGYDDWERVWKLAVGRARQLRREISVNGKL